MEDGKGISRQEFYSDLPGMKTFPTTATASSGTYQQLYQRLFQEGFSHIISIHAGSLLSRHLQRCQPGCTGFWGVRARHRQPLRDLGLGFQALAAAEAALHEPLESVLALIEDVRQRVRVVALLDTLEYVRRSGRVSWARAHLGELLQIKPLIESVQDRWSGWGRNAPTQGDRATAETLERPGQARAPGNPAYQR